MKYLLRLDDKPLSGGKKKGLNKLLTRAALS